MGKASHEAERQGVSKCEGGNYPRLALYLRAQPLSMHLSQCGVLLLREELHSDRLPSTSLPDVVVGWKE